MNTTHYLTVFNKVKDLQSSFRYDVYRDFRDVEDLPESLKKALGDVFDAFISLETEMELTGVLVINK